MANNLHNDLLWLSIDCFCLCFWIPFRKIEFGSQIFSFDKLFHFILFTLCVVRDFCRKQECNKIDSDFNFHILSLFHSWQRFQYFSFFLFKFLALSKISNGSLMGNEELITDPYHYCIILILQFVVYSLFTCYFERKSRRLQEPQRLVVSTSNNGFVNFRDANDIGSNKQ